MAKRSERAAIKRRLNEPLVRGPPLGPPVWNLILPTFGIGAGERTRTYICAIVRPGTKHPVLLRIGHFPQLSLADARKAARQMMIAGAPPTVRGFSKGSSTLRIAVIALALAISLPAIALTDQKQRQEPNLTEKSNGTQSVLDTVSDKDEDDRYKKKKETKKKLEGKKDKREKEEEDTQQPFEREDDDEDEDKGDEGGEKSDGEVELDKIAQLAGPRPEALVSLLSPLTASAVSATIETASVPSTGDAADDAAIWVNPVDPSQSTIIGTNKQGGMAVYALDGKQLQYLADGLMNNVDLRAGFSLGGQRVAIVAAGNRADNSIAIYRANASTRMLENVAARKIVTIPAYGCCLYLSKKTGKLYYFVASKTGEVEQWELFDSGGKVDAKSVRRFKVGTQLEGCVADDELGHIYVGEEAVGIWKYGAEPDSADNRTQVDRVGSGKHLVADVEGLTIAYGNDGIGYLIASSQGNNSFVVYRREQNNAYVKTFTIAASNGVDGVEETDGIDVTTANLGPAFPQGLFIAQDGINDKGNQNFKLVPLQSILSLP